MSLRRIRCLYALLNLIPHRRSDCVEIGTKLLSDLLCFLARSSFVGSSLSLFFRFALCLRLCFLPSLFLSHQWNSGFF
ncbi:hypothetical protein AXW93_20920 [Pseudomonas aeruginosa]|nr:hypothetical protein AXW93_20920 [Pseudomonas aeruginosa]